MIEAKEREKQEKLRPNEKKKAIVGRKKKIARKEEKGKEVPTKRKLSELLCNDCHPTHFLHCRIY